MNNSLQHMYLCSVLSYDTFMTLHWWHRCHLIMLITVTNWDRKTILWIYSQKIITMLRLVFTLRSPDICDQDSVMCFTRSKIMSNVTRNRTVCFCGIKFAKLSRWHVTWICQGDTGRDIQFHDTNDKLISRENELLVWLNLVHMS
jgi:hypothetical protein